MKGKNLRIVVTRAGNDVSVNFKFETDAEASELHALLNEQLPEGHINLSLGDKPTTHESIRRH